MSENSDYSAAAVILALCLGLSTCSLVEHYNKKVDVEKQLLEQQLKK